MNLYVIYARYFTENHFGERHYLIAGELLDEAHERAIEKLEAQHRIEEDKEFHTVTFGGAEGMSDIIDGYKVNLSTTKPSPSTMKLFETTARIGDMIKKRLLVAVDEHTAKDRAEKDCLYYIMKERGTRRELEPELYGKEHTDILCTEVTKVDGYYISLEEA